MQWLIKNALLMKAVVKEISQIDECTTTTLNHFGAGMQ
ncbi:MAG: hypothetical protein AVDCRST_MAG96-1150 [uncultured Segetibacter sp.]|uniref:Uncharacterized protein n=1 Tax=uncultured Segetibacter sp. TaxID=481133 RepID=A0A6J4RWW9_9BACT|nr:MAG: hypothetical protein AVDCRST_MAG96-1150 [uncultured Segetibacter sp.]